MPESTPARVSTSGLPGVVATSRLPGFVVADHEFAVPLDHSQPGGEQITVFARSVVATRKENDALPWIVYFQGGPGMKSPRPVSDDPWAKRLCEEFRVLLLDQRGTGRSTPASRQALARLGSPQAQADYLKHFRADAIVRDAEHIRRELVGPQERWAGLGQSFGGFCLLTYLSLAPEGLREVLATGGLASLEASAEDVYRATYQRVRARNEQYFARYPGDVAIAERVVAQLRERDVRLPNGERLSPRRFQLLGHGLGGSEGFENLHYVLEEAFAPGVDGLTEIFLRDVEANVCIYVDSVIYAILHEPCYCQGESSRWAAERVRAEYPEFDLDAGGPFRFTGEMIYPFMFDEDQSLQPLKEAADLLAEYDGWPALYDVERLRNNTVPVAATVYADDMYVDRRFAEQTAATVGNLRPWLTNEYQHNGLGADPVRILSRLFALARDEA